MSEDQKKHDAAEVALGAALYAMVRAMTEAGMRPATALRLSGFVVIEGALGAGAFRGLGLPKSTENRWRHEVRDALSGVELPDEPPLELLNELLPMLGVEGVELRRRDES